MNSGGGGTVPKPKKGWVPGNGEDGAPTSGEEAGDSSPNVPDCDDPTSANQNPCPYPNTRIGSFSDIKASC